jgi:hypothetical protein
LDWLICRCKKQRKQPEAAEGNLFAKEQSGMLPDSVRPIAEISACCPDFKVSHSLLGDFVVAPVPDALPSLIVRRGDAARAPLRRPLRVTVIVRAIPSGGELTG